jgi:hypothetical protein
MTNAPIVHNSADLVGFGRLATDAIAGLTDVVEAVHGHIAFTSRGLGPRSAEQSTSGITRLVYNSIRRVTRLVEGGLTLLASPASPANDRTSSSRHEAVLAALNGVVGDHLARTNNPLAISMSLRHEGHPLEIERRALRATIPHPTGKLLLLAHGLCLNDLQWRRNGHDHGASLAREFGYSPLYLRYNTGLHVSENGRELADLLETILEQWPVRVKELAIIGHSMVRPGFSRSPLASG